MQNDISKWSALLSAMGRALSSVEKASLEELDEWEGQLAALEEALPRMRALLARERERRRAASPQRPSGFLSERLGARSLSEGLTLNDRFRFASALFEGDRQRLLACVERLDAMDSYEAAERELESAVSQHEGAAYREFLELLARRFG